MLTARVASSDRVLGLDMGADDYVLKPFDPLELCARVKANIRRCEIITNQSVEDDIIEQLEANIPDFEYTIDENLYGRGKHSRKFGNSVWPEMNFVLTAYINDDYVETVEKCIGYIKEKFPHEGINLFVI